MLVFKITNEGAMPFNGQLSARQIGEKRGLVSGAADNDAGSMA